MRVKTSITLPKELLNRLDRIDKNRSAMVERAALAYLAQREKQLRDRKDIGIINLNAERLNLEALDTLETSNCREAGRFYLVRKPASQDRRNSASSSS